MASKKTLLIVDDDDALNDALRTKFGDKGYAVTIARDGNEAMILLRDHDYDAVLLDLHMPQKDGFEVLEELKLTRNAATPCYVITNLGSDVHCERAMRLGAKKCFVKSLLSLKDLVEIVDRFIA